jgi:hypothetical protein
MTTYMVSDGYGGFVEAEMPDDLGPIEPGKFFGSPPPEEERTSPELDWRRICRAYIAHVMTHESVNYIDDEPQWLKLDDDERAALRALGEEVSEERHRAHLEWLANGGPARQKEIILAAARKTAEHIDADLAVEFIGIMDRAKAAAAELAKGPGDANVERFRAALLGGSGVLPDFSLTEEDRAVWWASWSD